MESTNNSVNITNSKIRLCVYRAAVNWMEWQKCYEHMGAIKTNPILENEEYFTQFIQEYGLRWLGNIKEQNIFRIAIAKSKLFENAIKTNDTRIIDRCVEKIKSRNGKHQMSAISKIATFVAPGYFMPIDKYAKKGLKKFGAKPKYYNNYSTFITSIQQYAEPHLKIRILKEIKLTGLDRLITNKEGFYLRVLDVTLMTLGGRWSKQNQN